MKALREISGMMNLTLHDGTVVRGRAEFTVQVRDGLTEGNGTFACNFLTAITAIQSKQPVAIAFDGGVAAKVMIIQAGMEGLEFQSTGVIVGL